MSPRVQTNKYQKRLRASRIPFLLFRSDLILKALMKKDFLSGQGFFVANGCSRISALISKKDFLSGQGFFIAQFNLLNRLYRIVVFQIAAFKELFPQYYICFPTSV